MMGAIGRPIAAMVVSGLVLLGCAGPSPIPHDRYYRVAPPVPATPAAQSSWTDGTLYVAPFVASGVYAERALLVSEAEGTRIKPQRYEFWIDSPSKILQGSLIEHLESLAVSPRVSAARPRTPPSLIIRGRVVRFELAQRDGVYTPDVAINFEIIDPEKGAIFAETFAATGRPVDDPRGAGEPGFSAPLRAIFDQFVDDVTQRTELGDRSLAAESRDD